MNRAHGFTLIELMIVVLIIAILSAIAYPAYTKFVLRSRRSDAYAALNQAQAIKERCYAQYFSYEPTASVGTCPAIPATSSEGYYSISEPVSTASTYTVTATAVGPQAQDTGCATLSIDQAGNKTSTGGASDCWGS